ncbi:MAG: hypothetical protein LBD10_00570 [Desulfobulbus sp.]|uniref:hypothetical protein n=1 Tax=Desulfobulbus sp. TaxID=895 RepID=UPI00283DBB01|nr:hypothetical protein [Desulfobulbus sp.]MDR2548696.1 hypothetical protein [Desulfobulbus sp.]
MSEHEDKRAADRRLALLALAGEQPGPAGPCLEAETLAALVEGRLTHEESQACLAHIAGCEACYALWLQVDREWRQQRPVDRKTALLRLVRRPRVLTTVGSLLAAAASVALMLTLPTTQVDRIGLPQLQEKTMSEPVMEEAAAPPAADLAAPQPQSSPAEQPARPIPAPKPLARPPEPAKAEAPPRVKAEAARREIKADDAGNADRATPPAANVARERDGRALQEKKEKMAASPAEQADVGSGVAAERQDERRQEVAALSAAPRTPAQAAAAPPQTEQEGMPATADAWYARIRRGCQETPRPEFFSAIAAQGEHLLRKPATLSSRDRQRIEAIVAELGKKRPTGGRCPVLLELIESRDRQPQQ